MRWQGLPGWRASQSATNSSTTRRKGKNSADAVAMFCRKMNVCSSYAWTWMSGSVLCLADGEP
ncbi:hypothetical protein ALI22I_01115 [Saccharothrix sp. ALI-22-I]|uniref:hypothetical protein n=1 Tax=Saccharothrix sp. ALI-22-I TaxID=1933778 RepID=UPI00097C4798|nr:hypothetical protein [Saccharothrix sp. ALI-22-I]ONI92937.1 hypothetical protein ALI22I_01115 [Saccharothrix sp. ALI-22-I]